VTDEKRIGELAKRLPRHPSGGSVRTTAFEGEEHYHINSDNGLDDLVPTAGNFTGVEWVAGGSVLVQVDGVRFPKHKGPGGVRELRMGQHEVRFSSGGQEITVEAAEGSHAFPDGSTVSWRLLAPSFPPVPEGHTDGGCWQLLAAPLPPARRKGPRRPLHVVLMRRWGNEEDHHYVLGVYSDPDDAAAAGEAEKYARANKYEPHIEQVYLDTPVVVEGMGT